MEYKVLPQLLEELSKQTKKQRPESSTPAKIKAANANKAVKLDGSSSNSDKYSEADEKDEEDYDESPRVKDIADLRKQAEE